jgi:hypothetical protein
MFVLVTPRLKPVNEPFAGTRCRVNAKSALAFREPFVKATLMFEMLAARPPISSTSNRDR